MSYREVTMIELKEVLHLWVAGTAKKRIAAVLGLDPKTVRRYVEVAPAGGGPVDPVETQGRFPQGSWTSRSARAMPTGPHAHHHDGQPTGARDPPRTGHPQAD
jgi:hypothetical protein